VNRAFSCQLNTTPENSGKQLLKRPDVTREVVFHCRGHSEGLVDAAEVVVGELKRKRAF